MPIFVRLTASSDGSPVFVHAENVTFIRRRASDGGLPGTTLAFAGGGELIVREAVEEVIAAVQVSQASEASPTSA